MCVSVCICARQKLAQAASAAAASLLFISDCLPARPPACSWVFLSTAAGYEAGRFVDSLPPLPVIPATNATYFVADVLGNTTFSFNTTNELTWDPKANKTATEFTLNIQDNADGTFGYSLYITGACVCLGQGREQRTCVQWVEWRMFVYSHPLLSPPF